MTAFALAPLLFASLAALAHADDCVSSFNSGIKAADPAKRIAFYTKAVESCAAKPDIKGQAYYRRGEMLLFKKGDSAGAIEDFSKAIASGQKVAVAYTCRGFAYFQKEDYYSAIADFTQALKADPTISEAYTFRGLSYDHLGYIDEAIADLAKAKDLPQQNSELREIFEAAAIGKAKQTAALVKPAEPAKPAAVPPQEQAAQPARAKKAEAAKDAAEAFSAGKKAFAAGALDQARAAFEKAGALQGKARRAEAESYLHRIAEYEMRLGQARKFRVDSNLDEARQAVMSAIALIDTPEARLELRRIDEQIASARRGRLMRRALVWLAVLAAGAILAFSLTRRKKS